MQESKRVKFVLYVFVGASANVMAKVRGRICAALSAYYLQFDTFFKSRVSVHKPDIIKACMRISIFTRHNISRDLCF